MEQRDEKSRPNVHEPDPGRQRDARARAIQNRLEGVSLWPEDNIPPQRPADRRPADRRPTDRRPTDRRPADRRPADRRPTDRRPTDRRPTGRRPTGRRPTGQHPPARRRRKKQPVGCAFFLCAAAVILVLAGIITALIKAVGGDSADSTGTSAVAPAVSASGTEQTPAEQASVSSVPAESGEQTDAGQQPVSSIIGPVQQQSPVYAPLTAAQIAVPENGRVDMSYFDTALFIGDSLTQGFQVYSSGIPNAHYAAYVGAGPKQLMEGTVSNINGENVSAIDEILAASPQKVYILLGTNSLVQYTDEAFLKYYGEFLDFLLPQLPAETVYYLQGIPPVSAAKMAEDENYSAERICSVNASIARMAYERGLYYLDLYTALADESGALREDFSAGADGIHLNGSGYDTWREYLITHTVYRLGNPYLPGSPGYAAPAS